MFDLMADNLERERSNGVPVELEAGHLSLKPPRVAIHVEYALAKKVTEDGREGLAFRVVFEPGLEHVFDVFRVGSDGVSQNMYVDGFGRGVSKKMRIPITKVVEFQRPA